MNFMEWVQRRLLAHGFDPGIVDGIWGRNTMNAVIAFQRSRNLPSEGKLNEATLAALRLAPAGGAPAADPPARDLLDVFPWMELAQRKKGLHEHADNRELRAFLTSDGSSRTVGDPALVPWCGESVPGAELAEIRAHGRPLLRLDPGVLARVAFREQRPRGILLFGG